MVVSLLLAAAALLGLGWFASSLVASLAQPVALILAAVAGITFFVESIRRGFLDRFFSSDEGLFLGAGVLGAAVFYLVFVASQALITSLSPLAGVIVVGIGVAVFFLGPGVLLDLLDVVTALLGGE